MPLLETLEDSFTGALDLTKWPHSYGDPSAVGGRGRIPCTVGGFAGLRSATTYTLTGSHFLLRAFPPAANGATVTAALSVLVLTSTGGTDAGFIIDTAQAGVAALRNTVQFELSGEASHSSVPPVSRSLSQACATGSYGGKRAPPSA